MNPCKDVKIGVMRSRLWYLVKTQQRFELAVYKKWKIETCLSRERHSSPAWVILMHEKKCLIEELTETGPENRFYRYCYC